MIGRVGLAVLVAGGLAVPAYSQTSFDIVRPDNTFALHEMPPARIKNLEEIVLKSPEEIRKSQIEEELEVFEPLLEAMPHLRMWEGVFKTPDKFRIYFDSQGKIIGKVEDSDREAKRKFVRENRNIRKNNIGRGDIFSSPYMKNFEYLKEMAEANGLPPYTIFALSAAESGLNPFSKSYANARGFWQIMPGNLSRFDKHHPVNIHWADPYMNSEIAMAMLAMDAKALGIIGATVAYYGGAGTAKKVMSLAKKNGAIDRDTAAINGIKLASTSRKVSGFGKRSRTYAGYINGSLSALLAAEFPEQEKVYAYSIEENIEFSELMKRTSLPAKILDMYNPRARIMSRKLSLEQTIRNGEIGGKGLIYSPVPLEGFGPERNYIERLRKSKTWKEFREIPFENLTYTKVIDFSNQLMQEGLDTHSVVMRHYFAPSIKSYKRLEIHSL